MILEVQFQNFDARAECTSPHTSKFSYSKNSREPNINIFCENWCKAFFYIKEQTQKYNFEIWLFKSTILDPWKSEFLVFEENPPNIFIICVLALIQLYSALKTIDAQMFFWSVFLKTHKKKVIDRQKHHFGCFWLLITVFLCISKILIKITCVCLLFLKLKQKKNMKKYFF